MLNCWCSGTRTRCCAATLAGYDTSRLTRHGSPRWHDSSPAGAGPESSPLRLRRCWPATAKLAARKYDTSGRCRAWPPTDSAGSEVQIQAVDGRLVRTAIPVPVDDGPGKTVHLWDRTGAQPVLAAGNAAGDIDMLRTARFALVVHHDDDVREYAYDGPQILNAAAADGWTVLSMRDDFARLSQADLAGGAR